MTDTRLPVTLLTGFLGAGKTTLLNALLDDASAGRMAVIVNELGEAGLDHELIEQVGDHVALMESGCLCCSLRGDLTKTIADLIARRDAGDMAFDRIVIETTGVADPGPILQLLRLDPDLRRTTRMDGVVTVVDAANGPHTLNALFEAVSQVAMADLIVLSKTDLVAPERVIMLEERLRGLNPTSRILHAVRGVGLAGEIAGLTGLRHEASPAEALAWTTARSAPGPSLDNLSGLMPQPMATPIASTTMSPHDGRISSASIVIETPITDSVFDSWLETIVAMRGPNILRIKGIVFLDGIDYPFVFHGVQSTFDDPVPLRSWSGDARHTRIVMIARDLSERKLQRTLDMLRTDQKFHETHAVPQIH